MIASIAGEVDLVNAGDLLRELSGLLPVAATAVVLDATRLTFLDCAGLRTLLTVQNRAFAVGTPMVIAAPSPTLRRILEATGCCGRIRIFATVPEALAALALRPRPNADVTLADA